MPHCNSWIPTAKVPANIPPKGWKMCRNKTDEAGRRCDTCWETLSTHTFWPAREALARELAHRDTGNENPDLIDEMWQRLAADNDVEVRQALIGPYTPPVVLAMLSTDESPTVAALARDSLASITAPAAAF